MSHNEKLKLMKKIAYIAISLLILLSSCTKEKEHRYMVIHNDYRDTTMVVARYWRTDTKETLWNLPYNIKSVTEFTSDYGISIIYNVDCIIATDSINNK